LGQPVHQDLEHGLSKDGQAGEEADERHVHHGEQKGRGQLGQVNQFVDGSAGHVHPGQGHSKGMSWRMEK